jgi:hypothetical protein
MSALSVGNIVTVGNLMARTAVESFAKTAS